MVLVHRVVPFPGESNVEQPDLAPSFISELGLRAQRPPCSLNLEPRSVAADCGQSLERSVTHSPPRGLCIGRAPSGLFTTVVEEKLSSAWVRTSLKSERGRPTNRALNAQCRQSLSWHVHGDIDWRRRHVPSAKNVAPEPAKKMFQELFAGKACLSGAVLVKKLHVGAPLEAAGGGLVDLRCERVLHQVLLWIRQNIFWWVSLAPPQSQRHFHITLRVLQICALIVDISVTAENSACE